MCVSIFGISQKPREGTFLFTFTRDGGIPVYTMAEMAQINQQWQITFINDTERILVDNIRVKDDSLFMQMPLFETAFQLKITAEGNLSGTMTKGTSFATQVWKADAQWGAKARIPQAKGNASVNISGRWAVEFQRPDGSWRPAVAEWKQNGNRITGTIINPSGDYRFLEGEVWDHQLYVTAFDGSHIYAFQATLSNDSTIEKGIFFSGNPPGDAFRAKKNAIAELPGLAPVAELKPGENSIAFSFPDTDSNLVSLNDARFKNKVVIVQLMGSWCPNCMDETKFLSDFYNSQQTKEVEMVSLAYELSTDFQRSANSLQKFKNRFGVQYPMLITGAKSADPEKAAKTLPQLTDIKYFPTTLFIDKKGKVRKVHNGFYGPGAGEYFEKYKTEFFETIETLKGE
jgi:peroxiredoxin